jgi:hypothetical protein
MTVGVSSAWTKVSASGTACSQAWVLSKLQVMSRQLQATGPMTCLPIHSWHNCVEPPTRREGWLPFLCTRVKHRHSSKSANSAIRQTPRAPRSTAPCRSCRHRKTARKKGPMKVAAE